MKSKKEINDLYKKEVLFLFNSILNDEYHLYTKLLNTAGEKNIGQSFSGLLQAFQGRPVTLSSILDDVSNQAFALAQFTFGFTEEFKKLILFKQTSHKVANQKEKTQVILTCYIDIVNLLKKYMEGITSKHNIYDTSSFVLDLIEKHERMAKIFRKIYPNMALTP